ncbi:MAG: eCIS core domain-containing protein, partial [bacterium]
MSGAVKQLLSASSRLGRGREDDDLDDVVALLTPGKATRQDVHDPGGAQTRGERERDSERHEGAPLPPDIARRLAVELDVDVRDVRVHVDERAARAAAAIASRAFVVGNDIYFAEGAYQPHTEEGFDLIAREVASIAHAQRPPAADLRARDPEARRAARERRDPGMLVDHVRENSRRLDLPFLSELEEHFGTTLDYVEAYTGEAAELACRLMAAGAFAVRNVVAFADPSPQRETLMHELTHVIQSGGRAARAPARFGAGSLRVGAADSAVEHEASMHAARPTLRADIDTVHRTGPSQPASSGQPATTPDPARVTSFAQGKMSKVPATPDKAQLQWAIVTGGRATTRFYAASNEFSVGEYTKNGRIQADLDAVMQVQGVIGGGLFLVRTGGGYIISRTAAPNQSTAVAVSLHKEWTAYKTAWTKIKPADVPDFTWTNGKQGGTLAADDPAIGPTDTEVEDYRRAMRTAVVDIYANRDGAYSDFYKDVVQGTALHNKAKANIFEELIAKCANEGIAGADAYKTVPVWDKRSELAIPILKNFKKKSSIQGDGLVVIASKGTVAVTEAKAYAEGGGPDPGDKKQMRWYRALVEDQVPAYASFPNGIEQVFCNHVFYNIGVPPPVNGKYEGKVKGVLD